MLDMFSSEALELFALPPLSRKLSAALRDLEAKRPEIRRSALVDLVNYVDSPDRSAVAAAVGRILAEDLDPELRSMAAIAIADGQLSELLPNLIVALRDNAPRVQQMALLALGELGARGDSSLATAVRPLLGSPRPALRYQAIVTWSRILAPQAGLDELVRALEDVDEEVRWVAWSLIEESIDMLEGSRSQNHQAEVEALAFMEELAAVRVKLVTRAEDPAPRIQVVAASVLMRLGEDAFMMQLLERGVRAAKPIVGDLIERCRRLRFEPARVWLNGLARRGWLEGPHGWPATVALAALGDSKAESAILNELDARSARRRERALRAVSDLKLHAALARVRVMQQQSGLDPGLVNSALMALGEHDDG